MIPIILLALMANATSTNRWLERHPNSFSAQCFDYCNAIYTSGGTVYNQCSNPCTEHVKFEADSKECT